MISTTPEGTHYPLAKEAMLAGKHVFLEKPMALELSEADDLIQISREKNLRFTIGYSQRFNPKFAYVKRSLEDGTIGEPVSALVSRHITRNLGKKISGRVRLSPAAMEATHDIDFVLWCLAPRKPIRVYAQEVAKIMKSQYNAPDCVWIVVFAASKLTPLTASRSFGTTCHVTGTAAIQYWRTCACARPAPAKKTATRAASTSARDPRSEAGVTV